MPEKIYIALAVFQGVIDEVKGYRTPTSADRFVNKFEREQGISSEEERKHQRDFEDTYATWYECGLED